MVNDKQPSEEPRAPESGEPDEEATALRMAAEFKRERDREEAGAIEELVGVPPAELPPPEQVSEALGRGLDPDAAPDTRSLTERLSGAPVATAPSEPPPATTTPQPARRVKAKRLHRPERGMS